MAETSPSSLNPGETLKLNCTDDGDKVNVITILSEVDTYPYFVLITGQDDKIRVVGDVICAKTFIHPNYFLSIEAGKISLKPCMLPRDIERIRIFCATEMLKWGPLFTIFYKNNDGERKKWQYKTPIPIQKEGLVQVFGFERMSPTHFELGCMMQEENNKTVLSLFEKHI